MTEKKEQKTVVIIDREWKFTIHYKEPKGRPKIETFTYEYEEAPGYSPEFEPAKVAAGIAKEGFVISKQNAYCPGSWILLVEWEQVK